MTHEIIKQMLDKRHRSTNFVEIKYLIAEILKEAGDAARKNHSTRITPRHLFVGFQKNGLYYSEYFCKDGTLKCDRPGYRRWRFPV